MNPYQNPKPQPEAPRKEVITTSFIELPDGRLAEMLYDPTRTPPTFFALYREDGGNYQDRIMTPTSIIQPYPESDLLKNQVVLFPTKVEQYASLDALKQEVQAFIHRYLDVGPFYETLATHYVLLTWVYDRLPTLPYLRARGEEEGIGKTRFLQTIGALCYKPMLCGGATTASSIFRLIEMYHGTLIIDEADFPMSTDFTDIVKILNCGYSKGFPVIRNEKVGEKFIPRSYAVFGPKILASKREFQDKNLESRFLIKEMEPTDREDIQHLLEPSFWEEATRLRNKLLRFRFEHYHQVTVDQSKSDRTLDHRLDQITLAFLSLSPDEAFVAGLRAFLRDYGESLRAGRGLEREQDRLIIAAIREVWETTTDHRTLSMGSIASKVAAMDSPITAHMVGRIVAKRFRLEVRLYQGRYCIVRHEANRRRLERLAKRYYVDGAASGDLGDSGDL